MYEKVGSSKFQVWLNALYRYVTVDELKVGARKAASYKNDKPLTCGKFKELCKSEKPLKSTMSLPEGTPLSKEENLNRLKKLREELGHG